MCFKFYLFNTQVFGNFLCTKGSSRVVGILQKWNRFIDPLCGNPFWRLLLTLNLHGSEKKKNQATRESFAERGI